METICDWLRLWEELATRHNRRFEHERPGDAWAQKTGDYKQRVRRRWAKPDPSRDLVTADLQAHPGSTLLDIGAGTGAWSVYLAAYARQVTALDPSPAMLAALEESLREKGVSNVTALLGAWPVAEVESHDVSFCSHAMYGLVDFRTFIERTVAVTRRRCYLLLRAPYPDSVMAEAAREIWGQPYDSPNFQVAYNALLQMGIFADVQMEAAGTWSRRSHASPDEALAKMKHHFGLENDGRHDEFLTDLLHRRLTLEDGRFLWPHGVRSALVYWDVL